MQAKNTFFLKKSTLNCGGKTMDLTIPVVMGILNLTPDSFYDGGTLTAKSGFLERAGKMLSDGAGILDVGGMSSRPGAAIIPKAEELRRVIGPIRALSAEFPDAIISIDTIRAEVARQAIDAGANMINDISGGTFDPEMYSVAADHAVPYILMHMQGQPESMQKHPSYDNVVLDITDHFSSKVELALSAGVKDIIIDPGFGFGKTIAHNYQLLRELDYFKVFGLPLMVGVSRKSIVNNVLKTNPQSALNGTTVIHTIALLNGANILRVHDVKEAVEAVKIVQYYLKNERIL